MAVTVEGVEIRAAATERADEVLTDEALAFVAGLQRQFGGRRSELLEQRDKRQAAINAGAMPDFLAETRAIREGEWRVAPAPEALRDRRVEITGPVERKMMINALNSGARIFMADFEDSNSPTWENVVVGQANLSDAIAGSIEFTSPEGKAYRLNEKVATLVVRPRGWHLVDKHLLVDGEPVSGGLLDFGLYVFRNARRLLDTGSGPFFYLPKLEGHLEARLWNDVFVAAEDQLGLERGSIRATVLIETVLAAFEMDEILHELREHSGGLNAGRWDYIFSFIKKFQAHSQFGLPDRSQVSMGVPFMRAYSELLVKTCHRRGAHAIGGMAAFIPSRRDAEVNRTAIDKVREDKQREAAAGFDGTWVAHPDLVPVALEVFDAALGDSPNQLERQRDEVRVSASDLLDVRIPDSSVTEAGVRNNISVGLQYLEAWLRGNGAVGINNLMEDAATAEISRSQLWQWVHHGATLNDGTPVTAELVREIEADEVSRLGGEEAPDRRLREARELFDQVALSPTFVDFLTLPAYDRLD